MVSVSGINRRPGDSGADGAVTTEGLVLASDTASEVVETVELVDGAQMQLGISRDADGAQIVGTLPGYSLQGLAITELPVQCEILT